MRRGILILALICLVAGCGSGHKTEAEKSPLKQQTSDLLAGQVTAVAYSGFRDGQHPDRGDGAVLPSRRRDPGRPPDPDPGRKFQPDPPL